MSIQNYGVAPGNR